ncbi:hypothetical protein CXB77_15290 [Chromatium okenii]|uniref:Uncharacterized protein n=2 Tax=Chromatium okenii TaxID=61644 RepID=A0A2S7XQ22_9GAMM|nr:hypothetical protein CXB77_15290 [Chromatium okenii]
MPIKLLRWVANKLLIVLIIMLLLSVVMVVLFRWVNPPTSAIMLQHWISAATKYLTKSIQKRTNLALIYSHRQRKSHDETMV